MKLYLKPKDHTGRGKRIFLMEKTGMKRVKRNGKYVEIWLYNDKAVVDVNIADAKDFMNQDPHLITDEMPDFSKPYPTTLDEFKAKLEESEKDLGEALKDINTHSVIIDDKDQEIERLKAIVDKSSGVIEELKATVQATEERIGILSKQLDEKSKALDQAQKKLGKQ